MKGSLLVFVASFAFGQPQFVPAPRRDRPVETGTASIEGTVVNSLTHSPIRSATVTLSGRTFLRAVTGADGHFAFRQLPAGPYTVQAQSANPVFVRQFNLDLGNQTQVSVTGDEQKTVELSLSPGGVLRGHIVDEEGSSMAGCNISASRFRHTDTGNNLLDVGSAQSDDQGEYHIEDVPAGRYYVVARCFQSVPMPHPLIRRDAVNLVPRLRYAPLFYPGSRDMRGGMRIRLTPGMELTGIDFQMQPATSVPVRGHVQPLPPDSAILLNLRPKDPILRRWAQAARVDPRTGEFVIPGVLPGSYELVPNAQGAPQYWARVPIEVGTSAPEPIDVMLAPIPLLTGSVTVEGDIHVPLKNLSVSLNPIDEPLPIPRQPAPVQEDGSFTVNVPPGRWRLQVNGAAGYVKSMTLGDQEVSPSAFDIGSAPTALKVVFGTKTAEVQATLPGLPPEANAVTAVIWAADGPVFQQNGSPMAQTSVRFSLTPGRYYGCAITAVQALALMQQDAALRTVLAGHCASLEVKDDSHTSVQLPFLTLDEVKRLADEMEANDSPAF